MITIRIPTFLLGFIFTFALVGCAKPAAHTVPVRVEHKAFCDCDMRITIIDGNIEIVE